MTMQLVKLGTPPSGSDGDDPRTAFTRINSNFKALDDMGLTGPVGATREAANLNDARSPGKWIGAANATNRPDGFTRSIISVVEESSGDLLQSATDKATGQAANRTYTVATDSWSAWVAIGSGGAPGEPLPIEAGGTGGGTADEARANLGLKSLATLDSAPIDKGGTGGATAAEARQNLGLSAAAASFTGAASAAPGAPGLVPAPAAGDQDKVLRGDGTWGTPQAGGSRFFGELVMLPNRQSSPNGVIKADGQWINNATAQYPAAVADLQSATPSVPATSAANWEADPLSRGCWVWDAANDRIRAPDWNGMQAGSIGPLMFRGDGTLGFAPGKLRMDQIQNITGTAGQAATQINTNTAAVTTGAFAVDSPTNSNIPQGTASMVVGSPKITFDASRVVRTGTETFGKHGIGVWGVVLFGAVSNPGAADAAALATSYANQQAAITDFQTKRRTYATDAPASVVGLNSITIDGIPNWVTRITVILKDHAAATGAQAIRLRTAAGAVTAGYKGALVNHAAGSLAGFVTNADTWLFTPSNVGAPAHGIVTIIKTTNSSGSGGWVMDFNGCADASINVYDARGSISITGDVTGIDMYRFTAGQNWTAGTVSVTWE